MSIDQIGQYTAKLTPSGGLRMPAVGASSGSTGGAGVGGTAPADGVSVGKLAQALKGPASGAFQHLDPKARGMLEGLVNSGKISAEDAVRGLNHLAKNAVFDRYMETYNTAEGAGSSKKGLGDGARAGERALAGMSALDQSYRQGDVSDADYGSKVRAAGKGFESALQQNGDSDDALAEFGKSMASSFAKKIEAFENDYGAENVPNNDPSTSEDVKALQKLQNLGFGASMYREAMTRYAAGANPSNFDAPLAASDAAPTGEGAPSTATTTIASVAASAQTAAGAATPAQDAAKPTAAKSTKDAGNAQAALSMLQSALASGAQKTGNGGVLGAASGGASNAGDTMSSALLDALKSGTDQAKTDASKPV